MAEEDSGATQQEGGAAAPGQDSKTSTTPGAESTTSGTAPAPGVNPADRAKTFEVYQNALENVDWGYKLKSGEERDIGHKSMMIAERAFIAASMHDPKEADKIYEQHAGRPPKEELLKRAAAAREAGASRNEPAIKVDDLTAGIVSVGQRRDKQKLLTTRDEMEGKMGNWRIALADNAERQRGHLKHGNDELLKQEKPRQDGLHLLGALRSGMRAGGEYSAMMEHYRRGRDEKDRVRRHNREYENVTSQIAKFEAKPGVAIGPTSGPGGREVARFGRAFDVVRSALDGTKAPITKDEGVPKAAMPNAATIAKAAASRGAGI